MEACARIGVTELWVSTTGAKPYRGRFGTDRFRTDVTWEAQLEATRRFLGVLAPIAREVGVHMNMETHEEITTFEIVRLIEATGADVMGVVLDTANPLLRGEHPLRAAERVAPFVRQTHFKDAYVELVEGGAYQESRPCGDGVIDFGAVLDVLLSHNPDVNLTFENDQPRSEAERLYGRGAGQGEPHLVELDHPDWAPAHPDLTLDERQEYLDLARAYTARVRAGEVQSWQQRRAAPFEVAESIDWIRRAEEHITRLLAEKGIARAAAAVR
jgi:sugar phosphate isomerase/epimerase